MAFFSDVARELVESMKFAKSPDWAVKTDRDLYRYAQYGHAIRRQLMRLEELREGRRLVAKYEKMEGQRVSLSVTAEEKIVQEILEIEKRIKFYQEFRETIELAIDYAWQDREYKRFIELYWWSGLPKTQARNLVMHELFISKRTFYRWREEILFRLAQLLGHLPPESCDKK